MISYIRLFLATGYKIINSIKFLKWYRVPHARISNINSREKRRELCSRKLEKNRRKEERLYFPKLKIYRGSNKILRDIDSRTELIGLITSHTISQFNESS